MGSECPDCAPCIKRGCVRCCGCDEVLVELPKPASSIVATLQAEVAQLRAELASLRESHADMSSAYSRCMIELDHARPIVEAAKAWRAWSRADGIALQLVEEKLIDAIDDAAIAKESP